MFEEFVLAASVADLEREPDARAAADAVEFRMDLADAPRDALAAYDGTLPVIATNRPEWEGGETRPDGRLDALLAAVEHDAVTAIDVELATLRGRPTGRNETTLDRLLDRARATNTRVIASVHDFTATPSRAALDELLHAACRAGDVGKLAVTAASRGDALRLLAATHRATDRGDRVATMAMGPAGSHTRVVAPVYGSRIGYAPVDPDEATAPGQFPLATLRELIERVDG